MSIYANLYICWMVFCLLCCAYRHGKVYTEKSNFFLAFASGLPTWALLYYSGFFNGVIK